MNKIIPYEKLTDFLPKIKQQRLVLAGGVFDILHPGHIAFLKAAKKQGDLLLVMLESDEGVRAKKGKDRPVNTQQLRADALGRLHMVNYILLLPYLKNDQEYYNLVKKLQPDIIAVTAADVAYNKKSEQAEIVGGRIVEVIKRLPHSTTDLIK